MIPETIILVILTIISLLLSKRFLQLSFEKRKFLKIISSAKIPAVKATGLIDRRKQNKGMIFWIKLTINNNSNNLITLKNLSIKSIDKNKNDIYAKNLSTIIYKKAFDMKEKYNENTTLNPEDSIDLYLRFFVSSTWDEKEFKKQLNLIQKNILLQIKGQIISYSKDNYSSSRKNIILQSRLINMLNKAII